MFSLLKLLCAEYNCDAVELRKILIEKSDEVEALIRNARMVAMWKDCCYTVDFQGFSIYGAHAIICETHGVPIDVDFEYNEGVKLMHKKLHCVTSADRDGRPIFYPLELVYITFANE
ncbi:hypothetical protein AAVH_33480 [Aphelenchoides avenae]|nr:hypothetical protein AAVH_33480 [Aphelenchus avenae]